MGPLVSKSVGAVVGNTDATDANVGTIDGVSGKHQAPDGKIINRSKSMYKAKLQGAT